MRCQSAGIVLSLVAAQFVQAGVGAPQLGLVRYPSGSVRAVLGVPGSFVIGPELFQNIDALSFSGKAGLIASSGVLKLIGSDGKTIADFDSHETTAVLSTTAGLDSALAWLPQSQSLVFWDGKELSATKVAGTIPGRVTWVFRNGSEATLLAVQSDDAVVQTQVALPSGDIKNIETAPVTAGLTWTDGPWSFFLNAKHVAATNAQGATETFDVPEDVSVEQMSTGYVHLSSAASKQDWVLRTEKSHIELWLLPAVPVMTAEVSR
jgi:hypothetical protein